MGYWTQKKQIGYQRSDIEPRKNELGIKGGILKPRKIIASKVNNLEVLLLQRDVKNTTTCYFNCTQFYIIAW
jgi:hypothetical protein